MEDFNFETSRQYFRDYIHKLIKKEDGDLQKCFLSMHSSDIDKKTALDQAFRDELQYLIKCEAENVCYTDLLNLVTTSVQNDMCSTSTLFIMLSDLFDMITLDMCDEIFNFVEERVDIWKMEIFYNAGKNYLLRMCNDLLRRLSKSQNTVFCGRIQLFLARLFPLEEKSGLNLMSHFNLDNVTVYNTKPEDCDRAFKLASDDKESKMDVEDGEMDENGGIPVDYNLYRKFWSLQDFFRKPGQCYEKVAWKTFTNFSDEILTCFVSYKLDDVKSARQKLEQMRDSCQHAYFAKYLTSEKLLDLQLSDSNFRRYVLIQFLILFQYLNAQVRFKVTNQTLTEDQTSWITEASDRVYRVLKETPPDGEQFAKTIEHILSREENWNSWKNDGCSSYIRKKEEAKSKPAIMGRGRKRSIGDDLKVNGTKMIKMGSAELTRLWNLCPDNMAACRSHKRNFVPSLEDFFEEAIEQSDPDGGVEEQYKLINDPTFSWKALRLLARKSPHFFAQQQGTNTNAQVKTVPLYLEQMIGKLAKELPQTLADDVKGSDVDETTVDNGNMEDALGTKDEENVEDGQAEENGDDDEEEEEEEEEENVVSSNVVSLGQLKTLAGKICENWKKLALELGMQEDEIIYFETESTDLVDQATKMLCVWKENELEKATPSALKQALTEIGQQAVAVEFFGSKDTSP